MEEQFILKKSFMENIINSIDSRIALFNFNEKNIYVSDKLFGILGLDEKKTELFLENPNQFINYLEEISVETMGDDEDCSHYIGIIDSEDKYIIVHMFKADTECFGVVIDKTVQVNKNVKKQQELLKVQKKSQTDFLTGLLNRNGFEEVVGQSLKSKPGKGTLCIFDMDNFKLVNDTLGHPVGDQVLKQFSDMLNAVFSDIAFIGRIGGDEFVVFIYNELTYEELSEILKSFIERVKSGFAEKYPDKNLSSSIGAAMVGSGTGDYVSLYKSADTALYKVKQTGKGHYNIV